MQQPAAGQAVSNPAGHTSPASESVGLADTALTTGGRRPGVERSAQPTHVTLLSTRKPLECCGQRPHIDRCDRRNVAEDVLRQYQTVGNWMRHHKESKRAKRCRSKFLVGEIGALALGIRTLRDLLAGKRCKSLQK